MGLLYVRTRAKTVVSKACDGRKGCWVFVDMFGSDACVSVEDKYAVVEYVCVGGGDGGM